MSICPKCTDYGYGALAAEAVRRRPGWAKGYYREGMAHFALGELAKAAEALVTAAHLEPANAPIANALREVRAASKGTSLSVASKTVAPETPAEAINAALAAARSGVGEVGGVLAGAQHDEHPSHPSDAVTATTIIDTASPEATNNSVYDGWPVAMVEMPGKGRSVIAERALNAGDVAYQAMPWAAVVSDTFITRCCAHCFSLVNPESGDRCDSAAACTPGLTRVSIVLICVGTAACHTRATNAELLDFVQRLARFKKYARFFLFGYVCTELFCVGRRSPTPLAGMQFSRPDRADVRRENGKSRAADVDSYPSRSCRRGGREKKNPRSKRASFFFQGHVQRRDRTTHASRDTDRPRSYPDPQV